MHQENNVEGARLRDTSCLIDFVSRYLKSSNLAVAIISPPLKMIDFHLYVFLKSAYQIARANKTSSHKGIQTRPVEAPEIRPSQLDDVCSGKNTPK